MVSFVSLFSVFYGLLEIIMVRGNIPSAGRGTRTFVIIFSPFSVGFHLARVL